MKIPRIVPFLALVALALFFWQGRAQPAPDNVLQLVPPGFVSAAAAEGADAAVLEALADEAGIAAYAKVDTPLDLSLVQPLFRTVEDETETYIIGSAPIPGYVESDDVHAYVDVDGWILAYYPQAEERDLGEILDWIAYHGTNNTLLTTKLENVVEEFALAAGATYTGSTHYHFDYPNATSMAVLVERTTSMGSFEFSIPGEWTYLERNYSLAWLANPNPTSVSFALNGTLIHEDGSVTGPGWHGYVAPLNADDIPADVTHTATVAGQGVDVLYGSIVLLYQVP
jgi:hypothetical protein